MEEKEKVSLATLARGGAIERFDDALVRVLENITDINTGTSKRSITLTVTFKPAEDRRSAAITIDCTPKLAGPEPVPSMIFIGKIQGVPAAVEHNPEQIELAFAEKTPVRQFATTEGGIK